MPTDDARALTHDYERWLARQIALIPDDLARKHREMDEHVFRFLRGTHYLWLVRAATEVPEAAATSSVPAIGDLHVENFGTWRDAEAVRRWGVNDHDELGHGPWLLDLVRLATSACLAPHIVLADDAVCAELWGQYAAAVPRSAVDLAEQGAEHLRRLVPTVPDADGFYAGLAAGPPAEPPAAVAEAARGVAEPGWTPTWHRRGAGTGSLGHRRLVGVGTADDGLVHAREGKELGPLSAAWATGHGGVEVTADEALYPRVLEAVRGPASALRVGGWQVRDLAPDVVRIELSGLREHPAERVLHSMAQAAADVHGALTGRLPDDVAGWHERDFTDAVHTMKKATERDFADFTRG